MILRSPKGSSFRGSGIEMDTGDSMVSEKCRLNSTMKTKRDPKVRSSDLGIFEGGLSRSKLRREYRSMRVYIEKEKCARAK